MRIRSRHGHYADLFETEAARLKKYYKDTFGIDITHVEATAIAAQRSAESFWNEKKLKEVLARLRGL